MNQFRRRHIPFLLLCLQVVVLAVAITSWWGHRDNTLVGNGRWIVGKDAGKFVFYTFDFMCAPLKNGVVTLTDGMGSQELLYHEPENSNRALKELRFRTVVSSGAYLWIEWRKDGAQRTSCRLSRNSRFPSGFYRHGPDGSVVEYVPFTNDSPVPGNAWVDVRLTRSDDRWTVFMDDEPLGTLPVTTVPHGHFGFRGSGNGRMAVHIADISASYTDPARPGSEWTMSESFRPVYWDLRRIGFAFLLALLVLTLRFTARLVCARAMTGEEQRRYLLLDGVAFLILLLASIPFADAVEGLFIPGVIVLGEIASIGAFLRVSPQMGTRTALFPALTLILMAATLSSVAVARHGRALGRNADSIWTSMKYVPPEAYVLEPSATRSSEAAALEEARELRPGHPFFFDGAYRDQTINCTFTVRTNCTLDVVFQQQAYWNRGDLEGEALPLQRRLLRMSTRRGVPQGLARGVGRTPAPFYRMTGAIKKDGVNTLQITTDDAGVRVVLNGEEDTFSAPRPLGYGATGFLVYEPGVTLLTADVGPVAPRREQLRGFWGFVLPVLVVLLLALLIGVVARIRFSAALPLASTTLFPYAVYCGASLFLSPTVLALFGRGRLGWMDLLALASALLLLAIVVALRKTLRAAPLWGNLAALTALALATLFVWDVVLPPDHPLRKRFSGAEAVAPGELVKDSKKLGAPWYANNRLIGSNTYIWRQEFGTKRVAMPKPDGVVRVFFLGGSQTWGSGAADSFSTFDQLLEAELREKGLPVEIYNAGVNGAGISKLAVLYRDLIRDFAPDLIVANIGLNDSAAIRSKRKPSSVLTYAERLSEDYAKLINDCVEDGTRIVLSQEAMCSETPLRPNEPYYDLLEELTLKAGGTVVKPAEAIRDAETEHYVWWDTAHYAPYGHRVMARELEPAVEKAVRSILAERSPPATESAPTI